MGITFDWKLLLGLIALVALLFGGWGCTQMTAEQVAVQQQQMGNVTEFAKDNGLGLMMFAAADADGSFGQTTSFKWSPVTGEIRAVLFNDRMQVMLADFMQQLFDGMAERRVAPIDTGGGG